jgi:hypothetical protein
MFERLKQIWKRNSATELDSIDQVLAHSCAGRVVNAITFIVVIFCLGLWITFFLVLKDQLFVQPVSGTVLTDLNCVSFFGGLVAAIVLGTMTGNYLRRLFWRMLTKRRK